VLGVQRAWSRSNSLLVCICSTMQWKLVGKVCCHMTSPLCLLSSISAMQDRAPGGRKTRLSISKSAEPGLAAAAASAPSTPSPGEALAGQPKSAARGGNGGCSAPDAGMGAEGRVGVDSRAPHLPGQLQPSVAELTPHGQ